MSRIDNPKRWRRYERPGTVDHAFDADAQTEGLTGLQSDAACAVPWVVDGHQAVQVFVDTAILDRAGELCAVVETWTSAHRDIDALSDAVLRYAESEGLSASIYEETPDDLSTGLVAIAFTVG